MQTILLPALPAYLCVRIASKEMITSGNNTQQERAGSRREERAKASEVESDKFPTSLKIEENPDFAICSETIIQILRRAPMADRTQAVYEG